MKVLISQLKARLSEYLNAVRRGQTVTVLNRRTPIAKLVPLTDDSGALRIDAASAPPAPSAPRRECARSDPSTSLRSWPKAGGIVDRLLG